MIYLLILLFVIIVAGLFYYSHKIVTLRKEGWLKAMEETSDPNEYEFGVVPEAGGSDKEWLFAGPPPNEMQGLHQELSHYPAYILEFFILIFYRLPLFCWKVILSSIKKGKIGYEPDIREIDIYNLIADTPIVMMGTLEGNLLDVKIPEMPLETVKGLHPGGLHIVFNTENKSIESAIWKGTDIIEEKGKILSLIVTALTFWAHPQTHIMSEKSAREIASKKIQELEPSNRFVLALHQGLLYGGFSPITENHPLSTNVNRDSGIESATHIPLQPIVDERKRIFRYYQFLEEGRKIVDKHLKSRALDVNSELLFNNMVVHSVDHYLLHKNLSKIHLWSMDGGNSISSYWRSQIFLSMWVHNVATPLDEERIGKLPATKYPFYNAVYKELAELDKELADCVLTSTSF